MKKLSRNSLVVFVLFVFIFSFSSTAQIRRPSLRVNRNAIQIYIQGFVMYRLDHRNNVKSLEVSLRTVRLTKGSPYKIVGVKFNDKDVPLRPSGKYYQYFGSITCFVGKSMEIKVGLVKRTVTRVRQRPTYVIVGTAKVKNFIKKYEFPLPNSVLTLANSPDFLPFRWIFAAAPEKTEIRIIPEGSHTPAFTRFVRGGRCRVPKSTLTQGVKYSIHVDSSVAHKFNLSRKATSNSHILFLYSSTLYFKAN